MFSGYYRNYLSPQQWWPFYGRGERERDRQLGLFELVRFWFFGLLFVATGVVLGLASYFANIFLPNLHAPYVVFAIIVPSLTIFGLILCVSGGPVRNEAIVFLVLSILWLTLGAWSVDAIGRVSCTGLEGMMTPIKNGGTMSFPKYCQITKTIEAFSWFAFITVFLYLCLLLAIISRTQRLGWSEAWEEEAKDFPWFGVWAMPRRDYGQQMPMAQPGQYGYAMPGYAPTMPVYGPQPYPG